MLTGMGMGAEPRGNNDGRDGKEKGNEKKEMSWPELGERIVTETFEFWLLNLI
jgi:hypothetical protein